MTSRDKKRSHRTKIYPDSVDEGEDGLGDEPDKNLLKRTREKVKHAAMKDLSVKAIASAKNVGSRWKKYITTRRQCSLDGNDKRRTAGMGLAYDVSQSVTNLQDGKPINQHLQRAHNRNLIEYFAKLAQSNNESAEINLEFVEKVLEGGADINCTDKYGQTVLHEVARAWHVDVAKFLLEVKADVNAADNFGRTPLHVAAAVDYPEMVSLLLEKNASKEACTKGENQTAVHYAAKNDACTSLKLLIKEHCYYKDVRDYKGRTPLQLAAELDRSETAKFLLELDDPAPAGVEDNQGQAAIVWMIAKMPPVAKLALEQFHTTDRASRKQSFHLQKLEPRKPGENREVYPQTALQMLILRRAYDLLTIPVVTEMINVKWERFGQRGAVLSLVINLVFILSWTLQGVLVEYDVRYKYVMPNQWWRIVLFLASLFFTGWQLKDELSEYIQSKKIFEKWKEWREKELEKELKYAHPRWPEEAKYIHSELGDLDKQKPQYFSDLWNIFDWICYFLLLVSIITHLIDITAHSNFIARLHIRIMAVTVILLWIRLLKNARAFAYLGPFIVMLTLMINDVAKFACLYLEFFIPFACAFWMMFGGDKTPERYQGLPNSSDNTVEVQGMESPGALLFSLFRLTLVDEYDYDGMKAVDSVMATFLVTCWLALSAVLMLNLLIALLSNTFQRVYDNAKANAVMQKAITIIAIEEGLSHKKRENFRKYIHTKNCPRIRFYDDDDAEPGEDLQKVTIRIKEQLEEMEANLNSGHYFENAAREKKKKDREYSQKGPLGSHHHLEHLYLDSHDKDTKRLEREVGALRSDILDMKRQQQDVADKVLRDISAVHKILFEMSEYNAIPVHQGTEERDDPEARRYTSVHRAAIEPTSAATLSSMPAPHSLTRSLTMSSQPLAPFGHTVHSSALIDEERDHMEKRRQSGLEQLRQQLQQQQHDASSSRDDVLSGSQLTVEVHETRPHVQAPQHVSHT